LSLLFSHEDLVGDDIIAVTQSQLNRLKKAHEASKGVTKKMSITQVAHNMKVQGGFLPLFDGLASQALPFLTGTVLPALGVGALSGLASTGVQKLVGNGLYIKKGGCVCEVETTRIVLRTYDRQRFFESRRWTLCEGRKNLRR